MKGFLGLIVLSFCFMPALAQDEQAPLAEKTFEYKDWSYKNIRTEGSTNLRDFVCGKKLVMVVYFAPWCPNWKQDAPIVQELYDKYRANGLDVIAVGEYDPAFAMKANLDEMRLKFPAVYESDSRVARQLTNHFTQRHQTGDTRKWGSPWYVFLEPQKLEREGEVLAKSANVVNGELIPDVVERFIRSKLALPETSGKTNSLVKNKKIEICEPEKNSVLKKP